MNLGNPKGKRTKKREKEILRNCPEVGEIYRRYGYPGLFDHISHEMLAELAPPKKSAIRKIAVALKKVAPGPETGGIFGLLLSFASQFWQRDEVKKELAFLRFLSN